MIKAYRSINKMKYTNKSVAALQQTSETKKAFEHLGIVSAQDISFCSYQ